MLQFSILSHAQSLLLIEKAAKAFNKCHNGLVLNIFLFEREGVYLKDSDVILSSHSTRLNGDSDNS